ncbi:hypothetical protein ACNVED_06940 [Legionella sp. D16C41]|uniref:hypothetical protein n=1 Tax=Legionella sp. D16C41 TaxID=3402688 RepID=UPI003AF5A3FC
MKLEFFQKNKLVGTNSTIEKQDNFYYLPIVERLKKEKWYLAEPKNIYRHFYKSPEDLIKGEQQYIGNCSRLSCYKVNLTELQVKQVEAGTKIQDGYRAAVSISAYQVESRIEFTPQGNLIYFNSGYSKNALLDEENTLTYQHA